MSAAAEQPVLSIRSLCVEARSDTAGALILVDNISLDLRPGEVVGLITRMLSAFRAPPAP